MISWLFEVGSLRLSTKNVTWNSTTYTGVVIPSTFSGVTMRWDIAGNGLIAPNELTFDVSNSEDGYTTSQFDNQLCTVRLIVDAVQTRVWKFRINRTLSYYGKITCYCVDFLQEYLTGDYPNTKSPKEIWSSTDIEDTDDYCVPVVLGTAYIPVRSVNTGTERFYILGESGPTYTIHEVMSPRDWPNSSIWSASTYDMDGYVNSGYQLLQPMIAESLVPGVYDPGIWKNGDGFYDMLCRYERSDTASLDNPAEWLRYVIEDFGVDSANIDSVSFTAAGVTYDNMTVGFDGGGWWVKEPRESVLSNLLAQTDSYLKCTDKVELHQFSKTPVEIITDVLLLSFTPSTITKETTDSGRVHWPESFTKPSDLLNGQAVVPTHNAGTELVTSSDILSCSFMCGQSINAQKAGILYFQKKYEQIQRINFSVTLSSIVNQSTLGPGHVVTVSNPLYGGTNDVIITEMTINSDMKVDISGVILYYLEDWNDLTTTTKDVVTDTSLGYRLATTDYQGNITTDADWDTLLNIPDRFSDTASLGINVTDSYLGYFDGTVFKSYIQNNGNFQFRGDDNNYINWNGSTLNIVGSVTIKNPSAVRSTLNVADGADKTSTVVGSVAYLNAVTNDYVTSIDGSKITTGYIAAARIDVGSIYIGNLSGGSTVVSNASAGATAASTVDAWRYAGGTYIDGGDIYTGTITASQINVANLFSQNITVTGTLLFSTELVRIYFGNLSSCSLYGNETGVTLTAPNFIKLNVTGAGVGYIRIESGIINMQGIDVNIFSQLSGSGILLEAIRDNVRFGVKVGSVGSNANQKGIYPTSNLGCACGQDTQAWSWVYSYNFLDKCLFLDEIDDLAELQKVKGTGKKDTLANKEKLDLNSLPRWATNYQSLKDELKAENGELITDADIDELILDEDELGFRLFRNTGHFLDLTSGAVRQLDNEITEDIVEQFNMLHEGLLSEISTLKTRITQLETPHGE